MISIVRGKSKGEEGIVRGNMDSKGKEGIVRGDMNSKGNMDSKGKEGIVRRNMNVGERKGEGEEGEGNGELIYTIKYLQVELTANKS